MKKINQVQNKILEYKFSDSKIQIRAAIFGNLLAGLIFLIANSGNVLLSPFAQLSLLTSFLLYSMYMVYDWRNPTINLCITGVYISIFVYEIFHFGIPSPLLDHDKNTASGKGALFAYMIYSIPYIYSLLRLLLVAPFIIIYFISKTLDRRRITF